MTTEYFRLPGKTLAESNAAWERGEDMYTDYCSIERRFPGWESARTIMLLNIPKQLVMYQAASDTLQMDWGWVNKILLDCPIDYYAEAAGLFNGLWVKIQHLLPSTIFADYLLQPMSAQTIHGANYKIEEFDAYRKVHNAGTLRECLEHELGLKEYLGSFKSAWDLLAYQRIR